MEVIAAIALLAVIVLLVAVYAPQWWIGFVIFLTFATMPAFVPQQLEFAGFGVYLHEVPIALTALYYLLNGAANRATDLAASILLGVTGFGFAYGLLVDNEITAVVNDARGLAITGFCVFIAGRVAPTPQARIALQSIKITLWISFAFVLLGSFGVLKLSARAEDASLTGAAFRSSADVTRILGPTTHLASVTLAITLALWAVKPQLLRATLPYFLPALGITVFGFSRNALVLIAITVLLTPFLYFVGTRGGAHAAVLSSLRVIGFGAVGVLLFLALGLILSATGDIAALNSVRLIYSAYASRVLEGLGSNARAYDFSALYRQNEVDWLKRAFQGSEFIGHGFGFRYRPPSGVGFTATSGTYYAHHFYWWSAVKVGLVGLVGYISVLVYGVAHAAIAPNRSPLRSAAAASLVGYLVVITVAPLPADVFGAPAVGLVLGIALLRSASWDVESCVPSSDISSRSKLAAHGQ